MYKVDGWVWNISEQSRTQEKADNAKVESNIYCVNNGKNHRHQYPLVALSSHLIALQRMFLAHL